MGGRNASESVADMPRKIHCKHVLKNVGSYTGGGAAYQHNVQVAIVDFHTKKLVAQDFFEGGMPPAKKMSSGNDAMGDDPKGIDLWIRGFIDKP